MRVFRRQHSASNLLDVYVVCAVLTVVATRVFLELTGYPRVGGGGLHIAHVLWGGALMIVSNLLLLLSSKPRRLVAAILGGIGLGLFIDEVGKFITHDVNYFFKPAAVIVYLTFLAIWLICRATITRSAGEPFLPAVHWPDRPWQRHAVVVFLTVIAVGGLLDLAGVVYALFYDQPMAHHGHSFAAYIGYLMTAIYAVLLLVAYAMYFRGDKLRALSFIRELLIFNMVVQMPFSFYEEQFKAFASVAINIVFIVLITRRDEWS